MTGISYLHLRHAGTLICSALLAVTPALSQQVRRSIEPPKSVISVEPAAHPRAESLARRAGDATFQNVPANYHVFTAATAGKDAGVEQVILNFAGETALTRIESKSKDFVLESGGTCHEGNRYAKGDSCSLMVRFDPQGAGHRLGHLEIAHSAEAQPYYVGLAGNGYAPVVSFTPSLITTVTGTYASSAGTIKSSTNLTVDGGDIVYIADTGNDLIKKIDSSGTVTTLTPAFATPASLAVDSLGFIYSANVHGSTYYFSYAAPWGVQSAFGYTYASGTCTPSAPCAFSAVGMSNPANISIDANDNLFFEEGTKGAAEMPVAGIDSGSGTFDLWYLSDQFAYSSGSAGSFAADAYGNIYTNYSYSGTSICYLIEEPLYNAEYSPVANRVAGGSKCGYSGDGGQARGAEISSSVGQIAFDVAGNMYFADAGNQRVRFVNATTGIISTIAGTGVSGYAGDGNSATTAQLSNPTGLTVDSQGQVYILSSAPAGAATQVLRKISVTGYYSFGNVVRATTTPAKVFTVANTGNSTLTLTGAPFFTGTDPSDYSIDPVTTTCAITAGSTLNSGQSCQVGIIFKPAATGLRPASLVFHDNTVTNTNTIQLNGNGVLPSPTMKITAPASGATVTVNTAVTFSASVTSTTSPAPTGTVTFSVNGTNIGSPVTLSSGAASTTFTPSATGTDTLKAVYSGDANYASVTVSESITVAAAASRPGIPAHPVGPVRSRGGIQGLQIQ